MVERRLRECNLDRRHRDRLVILHLSDLHFQHNTRVAANGQDASGGDPLQEERLNHLEDYLMRCQEMSGGFDLVVVTGDLVDGEKFKRSQHRQALGIVKGFLWKLVGETLKLQPVEERLVVVPGNHDYRFGGLLWRQAFKDHFNEFFGEVHQHTLYPKLNLLIGCFDSNGRKYRGELATGHVRMEQFHQLNEALRELGVERAAAERWYRLALVHHHPLPIAETEEQALRERLERFVGRKWVGAQEFLLLRNAGTFLARLLQERFRLLLHGHLHFPASWRPVKFLAGQEEWLQVVACGSSGVADQQGNLSFNIIKIYDDGFTECTSYGFQEHSHPGHPLPLATVPYEIIREREWDRCRHIGGYPQVRCRVHRKKWVVIFPSGDLVTVEDIVGLSSATEEPLTELPIYSRSLSLSRAEIKAESRTPERNIRVETQLQGSEAQYVLRFSPAIPAGQTVDVKITRKVYGVMFSSTEAQKNWGVSDETAGASENTRVAQPDVGTEHCQHLMRWPCEQLTISLRFQVPSVSWLPHGFRLKVLDKTHHDPNPPRLHREESSTHVTMLPLGHGERVISANAIQAMLNVYRPRVGYSYGMHWDLPQKEPVESPAQRTQLELVRQAIFDVRKDPGRLHLALEFLAQVKKQCCKVLKLNDETDKQHINDVVACLFGFNAVTRKLECVATTASTGVPQFDKPIGWGRAIIGNAFRRREPMFYSQQSYRKAEQQGTMRVLEWLPDEVQLMFAGPLDIPPIKGAKTNAPAPEWDTHDNIGGSREVPKIEGLCAAVVALTTVNQGNPLKMVSNPKHLDIGLMEGIMNLWYGPIGRRICNLYENNPSLQTPTTDRGEGSLTH